MMSSNVHVWLHACSPQQRQILQELWTFVWTKKFKNSDALPDNVTICEIINNQMLTENFTRQQLCASSHMIYATVSWGKLRFEDDFLQFLCFQVNLYKLQVNKLLNQTKSLADKFNQSFYNDNWWVSLLTVLEFHVLSNLIQSSGSIWIHRKSM